MIYCGPTEVPLIIPYCAMKQPPQIIQYILFKLLLKRVFWLSLRIYLSIIICFSFLHCWLCVNTVFQIILFPCISTFPFLHYFFLPSSLISTPFYFLHLFLPSPPCLPPSAAIFLFWVLLQLLLYLPQTSTRRWFKLSPSNVDRFWTQRFI